MKLPEKYIRIGLLMIISQALLIGFTIYWINGQFDKEKKKLLSRLNSNYMAAYESGLDSLLVKQYIKPALGDSAVSYYRYKKPHGAILMADTFKVKIEGDSAKNLGSREKSRITINLSSSDDSINRFSNVRIKELEEEMLLRSMRLIVQHIDDSSNMRINAFHGVESDIDSLLFVSDFESRIEREGINIKGIWASDGSIAETRFSEDGNLVIGGWTKAVPAISVEKYRTYLFGQILPQILFSVILIFLTALSFIIAFRSLRKQTLLNEMRNSFISNISHELKTPVSTVKVAIEAIRNFDLKKDAKQVDEYLGMASKEIKRLELLISKVLDNSVIEQDNSILRFEIVDISEIVQAALDSLAPRIIDAKADVIFNPTGIIRTEADPMYLQGVIINLIDNSLKYGNGNPRIEIVLLESDDSLSIIVSDNGPGIPKQYLDRIFDKFFRIPTSDVHNVKGYGLGLSFAALIIEMHGGEIVVRNNDIGCSFTIKLPRNKA